MSEDDIKLLIEDEFEFFQKGKVTAQQLDEQETRRKLIDISKECLTPDCDA